MFRRCVISLSYLRFNDETFGVGEVQGTYPAISHFHSPFSHHSLLFHSNELVFTSVSLIIKLILHHSNYAPIIITLYKSLYQRGSYSIRSPLVPHPHFAPTSPRPHQKSKTAEGVMSFANVEINEYNVSAFILSYLYPCDAAVLNEPLATVALGDGEADDLLDDDFIDEYMVSESRVKLFLSFG